MRKEHAEQGGILMESAFRDATYTRYFYPEFGDFSLQVCFKTKQQANNRNHIKIITIKKKICPK